MTSILEKKEGGGVFFGHDIREKKIRKRRSYLSHTEIIFGQLVEDHLKCYFSI